MRLSDDISEWQLSTNQRKNEHLKDFINYSGIQAFSDHFVADKQSFLNRRLTDGPLGSADKKHIPLYVVIVAGSAFFAKRKKLLVPLFFTLLFLTAAYGLLLKSYYQYGWVVYYGPVVSNLILVQFAYTLSTIAGLLFLWKKLEKRKSFNKGLFYLLLPLSFGLTTPLRLIRYTFIEEYHYLGLVIGTFKFYAVKFRLTELNFVSLDLNHTLAGSLIKLNLDKIWDSVWLSLIFYPLFHIAVALMLSLLMTKFKPRIRKFIFIILALLLISHLTFIAFSDPRVVVPVNY